MAICFASIVFDGYDLIVYGTVVAALLEYREWDLTSHRLPKKTREDSSSIAATVHWFNHYD